MDGETDRLKVVFETGRRCISKAAGKGYAVDATNFENRIHYNVKDIYALPEGKRAEIIDGRWYDMAHPSPNHQRLVGFLYSKLREYIRKKGGDCEVFPAPFAVFLNADDRNYVEPDLSVVCDRDRIDERGLKGAPDLVAEVVSPASKRMDYYIKLFVSQMIFLVLNKTD